MKPTTFYARLLRQLFGTVGTASNVVVKNAANTFTAGPQVMDAGVTLTEQAAPTGAAGKTVLYADSTSHKLTAKQAGNTAAAVLLSGAVVDADIGGTAAIASSKLADTPTALNTAGDIVLRDGSGNFAAGTITANLTGNASGSSGSCTGNAATATTATTATNVTVADESTDTTCFPLFVTAATGDLAPKTTSNWTFNSSTGATRFYGTITGPTGTTAFTSNGGLLQLYGSAVAATEVVYEASEITSYGTTTAVNLVGKTMAQHWQTKAWDTGAAASKTTQWRSQLRPVSGNPVTSFWELRADDFAGNYSTVFSLSNAGTLTVPTFVGALTGNADTATTATNITLGTTRPYDYILCQDQKAQNTNGGTFTSGAWQKRTLLEITDTGNHCAVADSVITLAAGTYECRAECPAYQTNRHQARLQDTTGGGATLLSGSSAYSETTNGDVTISIVTGRFTLAVESTLELQHQAQTTAANIGFGVPSNFGTEVYASIELRRVGP